MCIFFKRKNKQHLSNQKAVSNNNRTSIEISPSNEKRTPLVKTNAVIVEEVIFDAKNKIPKYHVSQNKNQETSFYMKWRVRKDSSNKTIQFFNTQKEGINYAKHLAEKAKSSVVIHKLDGTIRKQDYTK